MKTAEQIQQKIDFLFSADHVEWVRENMPENVYAEECAVWALTWVLSDEEDYE